ncbi:hypothetical protein V8C86DRAFT_2671259, partial [Haematococcus lacustris]
HLGWAGVVVEVVVVPTSQCTAELHCAGRLACLNLGNLESTLWCSVANAAQHICMAASAGTTRRWQKVSPQTGSTAGI